ncbi:MAG: GNAT family N-acetyltransferase [Candidatus Eisenbacteria bacterium]|nr:GNAT family N-acetyltransferase [Candidatus Eisenbacteria bacterium]
MSYGWIGEKVRLVPLDREKHLENAILWLNDPEVTRWLLVDIPITRLQEERYFEENMVAREDRVQFAVETLGGEHIGFTGLFEINQRHRSCRSGIVIGPPSNWRKGYGLDAIRVRSRFAFEALGLRLLLTEAMAENEASVRALRKAGYRELGVLPKRYWRRGAFRDAVQFFLESPLG